MSGFQGTFGSFPWTAATMQGAGIYDICLFRGVPNTSRDRTQVPGASPACSW